MGSPGFRKTSFQILSSGRIYPCSVISPQSFQNSFQLMKKSLYSDSSPFAMISWNCFDNTEAWFRIKSSFNSIPSFLLLPMFRRKHTSYSENNQSRKNLCPDPYGTDWAEYSRKKMLPLPLPFSKIYNIIQGSAQTIRVEIQHRSYVHNIFPFYF